MKLKDKGIGFWLCALAALCAVALIILLLATGSVGLPDSVAPTGVVVTLIIGVALQIAFLFLPVRFAAIAETAVYSVAFGILANKVSTAFAGYFNGIMYAGGNFALCMAYAVICLVAIILCVAAAFFGQTKSEKYLI